MQHAPTAHVKELSDTATRNISANIQMTETHARIFFTLL
uniref:Uncharacterized protein n=1 Tax=Anguilla anguilla TaxID=7936 RepID=A0A0E9TFV0_ANGAN